MSRIGLTPDNDFAETFKGLRRSIEEIKQAQRMGRDIIRPKVVEALDEHGTPTQYDLVTQLAPPLNEFQTASFTVILEADSQQEVWASPVVRFFYGSPSNPATDGQASGGIYLSQQMTKDGQIAYRGNVNGQYLDTTPIYVKFYMYATDTGKVTVLPEFIE